MTNNKKSTIIRQEHTKTGSTQNGVCLVELRILYSNCKFMCNSANIIFLIKHKIQQKMNKENTTT